MASMNDLLKNHRACQQDEIDWINEIRDNNPLSYFWLDLIVQSYWRWGQEIRRNNPLTQKT